MTGDIGDFTLWLVSVSSYASQQHLFFRFCCSIWGTCGVTTLCTLEKLQNRVIRIITDSPYDAPAKLILRQLRLPRIAEMIRQESAIMVYKAINGQAPTYLSSLFNSISAVTNRSISAVTNRMLHNFNSNLRPPRIKAKFVQNSFAYRGAKIWNSLPNDCRKTHISPTFKEKLKAMIVEHHLFISLSFVLLFLRYSL